MLADRLGWTFIDSDAQIEREAGVSIRQIFDNEGEAGFREREVRTVSQLVRLHKVVLALGGGAVVRDENRRAITMAGPVVWLLADPEEILRRISDDPASLTQRPNLTAQGGVDEIIQLLAQRRPLYESCSDCQIDTQGKSPIQIVDEIMTTLRLTAKTA
jgi:shikimate kinase